MTPLERRQYHRQMKKDDKNIWQQELRKTRLKEAKFLDIKKKKLFKLHGHPQHSHGYFIGIDGEGEEYGQHETFMIGDSIDPVTKVKGTPYTSRPHRYTLLAASTGDKVINRAGLTTIECFNFLCDLRDKHPLGILVIFSGMYDFNHMLKDGFDKEQMKKLCAGESVYFEYQGVKYGVELRSRKCIMIRRGMYKGKTGKVLWQSKVVVWDVWGLFQGAFVEVIEKWIGKDYKHYNLIKYMKAKRGEFENVGSEVIEAYNAAELEALVEIMNQVRECSKNLGLHFTRWDGAGAVAASMLKKNNIRNSISVTPQNLIEAVRCAYSGGRIEVCKIGNYEGKVYDYDINSAYPSILPSLPDMSGGEWSYGMDSAVPNGFTIVHCKYHFCDDLPFYPLYYRTELKEISFPQFGEGWYWHPEYVQACNVPGLLEVIEWWHYEPKLPNPFLWVRNYYEKRRDMINNPVEKWYTGGEKMLKLGCNSIYGKLVQQVGYKQSRLPPFHQMEWGGYITSAIRAKLFGAGFSDCDNIIGFATDGIFSKAPLKLDISESKEFGKWELKKPVPDGITIAMPGVYWWHTGKEEYQHFSRGFDKKTMRTPDIILDAWKRGEREVTIPTRKIIGLPTALTSDVFWHLRARFCDTVKKLTIDGGGHKRMPCDVVKDKPYKNLISLEVSPNIVYQERAQGCSFPYPLAWENDSQLFKYLDKEKDEEDTRNI